MVVVEDGGRGNGENDEVDDNVEPEAGKCRAEEVDRVRNGEPEQVEGRDESEAEKADPHHPDCRLQFGIGTAALENVGHGFLQKKDGENPKTLLKQIKRAYVLEVAAASVEKQLYAATLTVKLVSIFGAIEVKG